MSKLYKLGVIGDPIEHSLSPFIHSRFSRNENINIEYLPYKVTNSDFIKFIDEFFSDKFSKGLNVTLPHKKIATQIKGEISEEASYINAVNTIVNNRNKLYLYSTDGIGFLNDMDNKGFNFKNKRILMIGAGAASESVLYRVAQCGVENITLTNRTKEKADRLVRKFSNIAHISSEIVDKSTFDLVINGSSAGLTGDFKPIENIPLDSKTRFYDLNYSLTGTPFCKWAKQKSDYVNDGAGMLVYQAAHSFEKWFNVFPETNSVIKDIESMRE